MQEILSSKDLAELQDAIQKLEIVLNGIKAISDFKQKDMNEAETYTIDSMLILDLYSFDVFILFKNLGASKSKMEAKMMCRLLSMILYEFIDDMFKRLGKEFITKAQIVLNEFKPEDELKPFRSRLNEFKDKFQETYKEVRNNVAAHRDQNPHSQLKIIEGIKVASFIESSEFFMSFTRDLHAYLFSFLERIEAQKGK